MINDQDEVENNHNIQKQIDQFEHHMDSQASLPAKPMVAKVTLSKTQVKLNDNFYQNKENSKPVEKML